MEFNMIKNKKGLIGMILFTIIVLLIVGITGILMISKLSNSYSEIASDKCSELDGQLVQYSGCNSFFNSNSNCHKSGMFCLLSNGSEIPMEINVSGEIKK